MLVVCCSWATGIQLEEKNKLLCQSQHRRKTTDVLKASGTEESRVRLCKKMEKEAQKAVTK